MLEFEDTHNWKSLGVYYYLCKTCGILKDEENKEIYNEYYYVDTFGIQINAISCNEHIMKQILE